MRVNLINRRKHKNLTQQEMADLLEISRSTYGGYELGTWNPPLDVAVKIKQILNYKNDDLFFLEDKVGKTDNTKEG